MLIKLKRLKTVTIVHLWISFNLVFIEYLESFVETKVYTVKASIAPCELEEIISIQNNRNYSLEKFKHGPPTFKTTADVNDNKGLRCTANQSPVVW